MKAKKILNSDIEHILISSLPSHPTAPRAFGGRGYSASEMKEAFDKLPLYIVEEYNKLLSDVKDFGENSLASAIPTGIKDGHSLHDLFEDVKSGELAAYFGILGKSLLSHLITLYAEIDEIKSKISMAEARKAEENNEDTL
jgi:hypothetical protein